MTSHRIVWEDSAKRREVELHVELALEAGLVRIETIRPTTVTFFNAEGEAERTIGVHTETGRDLLARQFLASCDGSPFEDDLHVAG